MASTTPITLNHEAADKPTELPGSVDSKPITAPKLENEKTTEKLVSPVGITSLDSNVGSGSAVKVAGFEDGLQTESQGEGTGTKYVKSSGLVADSGDFDASNPGAGKEADRECFIPMEGEAYANRRQVCLRRRV